jgi:glutamate carboxypeptidase
MVDMLAQWVNQDSPTYDKNAVDTMGQMIAKAFVEVGCRLTTTHPQPERGDHYTLAYGEGTQQILLLHHFDTVWPMNEASQRPFTIVDGCGKGPGVYDMKAGTLISLFALKAIDHLQLKPRHKLVYLLTSDEEIGSPTSRSVIEDEGKQSDYCFVYEGAINLGLTIARKGVARFKMNITGLAAHSGVEPDKGVSAIEELARQIQGLHALTDFNRNLTVNVGVIKGGERPNIVAPHAFAEIDLRVATQADGDEYVEKILNLQPQLSGCQLNITGQMNRSPWEETSANLALFEKAKHISEQLGFPTDKRYSGGGSDGNFVAALGVPTIDGLGAVGGGAHALTEHVILDMLPIRAALTAELIMSLT